MTAFVADTAEFRQAVCKVVRVIPERVPYPVLKGILLTVSDGSVEVLATDLTATHRVTVAADVSTPGRMLVDGVLLARIVRNLPGERVAVELDERRWTLTLRSERTRYGLLAMPEQDYPATAEPWRSADLPNVRAAGPDSRERELTPPKALARWKPPSRQKVPYDPQGMQPGAAITWFRKVGEAYVEVSGQVWSNAPGAHTVWALVEGERRPSLVVEHTYGDHRFEEDTPHWVAFPKTIEIERTAA